MDVLNPAIVTIGKRRYRKNPRNTRVNVRYNQEDDDEYTSTTTTTASAQMYSECAYNDETCYLDRHSAVEIDDGAVEEDENIQEDKNGMFKLELQIPSAYFGHIIGRSGEQKRRLETDTKANIIIPSKKASTEPVIIKSNTKSNVISCKNRIQVLVATARQKQPFTHILTFPLNFDMLKQALESFKNDVLKQCSSDRGVDESIFQNPHKLHLTICTLTLMDEQEKNAAIQVLEDFNVKFVKQIVNSNAIRVNLRGLEYMNDDPGAVDVLYAKVNTIESSDEEADRLQTISDRIVQLFNNSGLMKQQFDKVKLHATVMNTLRRRDDENPQQANVDRERESFDARNVLKLFGNYDFGTYTIDQMHISVRYTAATDGYYEYIGKIKF